MDPTRTQVKRRERAEKAVLKKISSYENEILEFAERLVSIPTENPPGSGYARCADAIVDKLNEIGFESFRHGDCILAHIGIGRRTLYLHGHYDTVPASSRDQFDPYIKAGKLYGRGSSDMKGGLASMIYALKAVKECGIRLEGKICLSIVPDEETGGPRGSRYLLGKKLLGRDGIGMLMPEPTSGVVWCANRGAISLRIVVRGKSAHVGLQHQGVNAFEQMMKVARAFLKLKRNVERRTTKFKIEPEAARHSILLLGGLVEGGTNFNAVPEECSFTLDRRINPEENLVVEKNRLLSEVARQKKAGIDLGFEVLQEGESSASSEDSPVARALSDSIAEIQHRPPSFEMCPGLLETRFYAGRGIPAYAYGPGLLSVSHGPHEYVEMENIFRCAEVYALTAIRLLA
jgi:acetylornithine deacetylase/succinyl-diaminopimelate desuccinylase family protein